MTALPARHDLEEALVLAERVIVLSDRPGPRLRDDPGLVRPPRAILGTLGRPT